MTPRFTALLLAAATVAVTWCGCASAPRVEPGTGDIAFRIIWKGRSDLDLQVADPAGEQVSHRHRSSASGAILDLDCNADRLCGNPVENVYWPHGRAPAGRYLAWVRAHRMQEGEPPVSVRLLVLRGEEIVHQHRGELVGRGEILGPFAYSYAVDAQPAEIERLHEQLGPFGAWACTTELDTAGLTHSLILNADLSATMVMIEPQPTNRSISEVEIDGTSLSFAVALGEGMTYRFHGALDGDLITGAYVVESGRDVEVTCVRRQQLSRRRDAPAPRACGS